MKNFKRGNKKAAPEEKNDQVAEETAPEKFESVSEQAAAKPEQPEWPKGPGVHIRQANGGLERLSRGGISNNAEPIALNTTENDDV